MLAGQHLFIMGSIEMKTEELGVKATSKSKERSRLAGTAFKSIFNATATLQSAFHLPEIISICVWV